MDRNNMNELFEKMFKTEEHEGKQKLVMICTEDFNVPSTLTQLRMQYFQNFGQKLETNHVNDYVHSAVLVFFLYFEFYFAKCISCYDKNRHENQFHDFYVHLMNHLVGIIVTLMTFWLPIVSYLYACIISFSDNSWSHLWIVLIIIYKSFWKQPRSTKSSSLLRNKIIVVHRHRFCHQIFGA